jgi:hypothetical protein
MVPKPAVELSDDILALFKRAELASAQAKHLVDENDCWHRSVLAQLGRMSELGAEFRKGTGGSRAENFQERIACRSR